MNIPWMIPNFQQQDIESMKRVLDSGWLSMGKEVEHFEQQFQDYLGVKHAVAVNNGTSALDVALKCLGIKWGDEVIVPALTYIATANAVLYNRGTPVYVDADDSWNIDPELIEDKITKNTKAIMNVDWGGNPSFYKGLQKVSEEYNLPLVVDGAQSIGSLFHEKPCCTQGLINTTSFHQAKILTTIEGGMVFTDNDAFAYKARCIRNQGQTQRYVNTYLGNNYRMIDVVAGMGTSQIQRLDDTIKERRSKAKYYKSRLKNVSYPFEWKQTRNSYFFFNIFVHNKDALQKHLEQYGVETRFSKALENQPHAKEITEHAIALPLFQSIRKEQQDYVIDLVNTFQESNQ